MSAVPNELIASSQPHHQVLEIMASKALARRDFGTAFKLADRRCRIEPPPLAHSYVLRADANHNMGDKLAAIADLTSALEISPHDLAATRRLFAWGDETARFSAASDLIAQERDVGTLRAIIETLSASGQRRLASLSVYDRYVTGWAAWDLDETAELTIASEDGVVTSLLTPDPFHPLSSLRVRATSFHLARPTSSAPQTASIAIQSQRFFWQRMSPNGPWAAAPKTVPGGAVSSDDLPTVVVPVYADIEATKACLDSLIADRSSEKSYRILIINDASPEREIAKYLATLAKLPGVEVLNNSINLGFVGSINRALSRLPAGDVILLNADTLVPAGFVKRLRATARGSDDIGTVVPLSNNGGISDFPNPHHANPLGSRDDVIRLDWLAAKANSDATIDLPNGTGFCLYVTRACLNAVGGLSETFQRGYLEDIDLCLRAREHGFRNVCATSIYVGHAGSRSFQTEKRSLVLQNLGVLDQRFPSFRTECLAFIATDPLRSARQAIERLMPPPQRRPVLLLTGTGALAVVAQARAEQLLSTDRPTIFLETISQNGQPQIRFRAADQTAPQSLSFAFSTSSGLRDLKAYLGKLRPAHFEIIDPVNTPAPLKRILSALKIPVDLWLADGAWIAPTIPSPSQSRATKARARPKSNKGGAIESGLRVDLKRLRETISAARHLLAPCPTSMALATTALPGHKLALQELPIKPLSLRQDRIGSTPPKCLAVVPTRASAKEFSVIRALALTLQRRQSGVQILVAGSTFDDLRLMTHDNVFVAGPVDVAELPHVLQPHHAGWLLTGFDEPLFGHPLIHSVRQANMPVAFIDWSKGCILPRPRDLGIFPEATIDQMADEIVSWIEGTIS